MRNKLKIFFYSLITLISFFINTLYGEDVLYNTILYQTGKNTSTFNAVHVESFIPEKSLRNPYQEIFDPNRVSFRQNYPGKQLRSDYYHITDFYENEEEKPYSETSLRRFEIIFLISAPVAFGFSFIGLLGYRAISGKAGGLSPEEYRYLALSTAGICFSIALHDHRVIYSRRYK